jgi:hypothetical protein
MSTAKNVEELAKESIETLFAHPDYVGETTKEMCCEFFTAGFAARDEVIADCYREMNWALKTKCVGGEGLFERGATAARAYLDKHYGELK